MTFLYDNSPIVFPSEFSVNDILKNIDSEMQIITWQWANVARRRISPDTIKMVLNYAFDYYTPIQGETESPIFWLHKWFNDQHLQKANPFIIMEFKNLDANSSIMGLITASHDIEPNRITYPKERNLTYMYIGSQYAIRSGHGDILMGITIPDIDNWDIELQHGGNRFKIAGCFTALLQTYMDLEDADHKVILEKVEPIKVWYFELYPIVKYMAHIQINSTPLDDASDVSSNGSSLPDIKLVWGMTNPDVHEINLNAFTQRFKLGDWEWNGYDYTHIIKK